MSLSERKRQAFYSVDAFEDFNNVSGLLPESHKTTGDPLVRINPGLINPKSNKIQLISIQWHILNAEYYDRPRLAGMSTKPDLITDNKFLLIYKDRDFWKNLIPSIKND
ncbi:MAG: hypothetical protein EOM06_01090 [Sphingobacteriia bacterium]|nr:hypothetical protein [Sphingobacteriia bacterium]